MSIKKIKTTTYRDARNSRLKQIRKDYIIFSACPICGKTYDEYGKIISHIKKSKEKNHQRLIEKNIKQLCDIYLSNKGNVFDFFKTLYKKKNIFSAISSPHVFKMIKDRLGLENLEGLRREKISQTLSGVPKTADHNNNVALGVKKAWKDGKFNTDECRKARDLGYKNRRSFKGKGNPMYGKPCPKGAGRGKGGIRSDIGHYVRSTWEANMARIYQKFNRKYKYETKRFYVVVGNNNLSYCPDFYFADKDRYYEVKGHAKSSEDWICTCKTCVKNRAIMKEVVKKFRIKIIIIGRKEYNMIKRRFKDKINWEK